MNHLPLSTRLHFLWVLFRPEPVEFFTGLTLIGWGTSMFLTNDVVPGFCGTVMSVVGFLLGLCQLYALLRSPVQMTLWRSLVDALVFVFWLLFAYGLTRKYGIYPPTSAYLGIAFMNLSSSVRQRFAVA